MNNLLICLLLLPLGCGAEVIAPPVPPGNVSPGFDPSINLPSPPVFPGEPLDPWPEEDASVDHLDAGNPSDAGVDGGSLGCEAYDPHRHLRGVGHRLHGLGNGFGHHDCESR